MEIYLLGKRRSGKNENMGNQDNFQLEQMEELIKCMMMTQEIQ